MSQNLSALFPSTSAADAAKIKGVTVDDAAKADGLALTYVASSGNIEYVVAGGGDVVGPASATANAVPLYNGITGKLLKDGVILSTGANNIVQLNGSSELPAVSGANLTNLPSGGLTIVEVWAFNA